MRDVPEEELIFTPPKMEDNLVLSESEEASGIGLGLALIFWSCTAFLCTIAFCSLLGHFALAVLKRYFGRLQT